MARVRVKKKLRKLVRDPKRFLADSPLGRAAARTLERIDSQEEQFQLAPRPAACWPRESPLTSEDIKQSIADLVPVFFIDNGSTPHPVACTPARDWQKLIEAVLICSRDLSLSVSYWKDPEFLALTSAREALVELVQTPFCVLQLCDQRSSDVFLLEIESWKEGGDHIMAPRSNAISRKVWSRCLAEHDLPRKGTVAHLDEILACPLEEDVSFEVDIVYTWVNAHDPDWQRLYASHCPDQVTDASSLSRYYSRDELLYSLRALSTYAPWVRKVHIVSNCSPPPWLAVERDDVNWVDHREIFDSQTLPTFSSHAIEARLHRIEGLSNHFVYSNDDFLLTRPSKKANFFTLGGVCKTKLEGWGNVNGKPMEGEPDYLNGARNSQALIERDFQHSPTKLHTHSPQALRVDVLREMENRYTQEFEATARQKFRSVGDIAVTGFLFHHYALATGRAVEDTTPTMLVQQGHNYQAKYARLSKEQHEPIVSRRYLSACVNDGRDSHLNQEWNKATEAFLARYFPRKSRYER